MRIRPHNYVNEYGEIYEWKLRETMRTAPVPYHRILAYKLFHTVQERDRVYAKKREFASELFALEERVRRARDYMDHLPGGATVAELAYIRRLLDGGGG